MAYNYFNQYPSAYQPTPQNSLVWVQGEAGAKSYLLAPNTTAILLDSESSKMYIKSADATGMPTMRIFEYNEVKEQNNAPVIEGVSRAEFDELKARVEEILTQSTKTSKSKPQKAEEV